MMTATEPVVPQMSHPSWCDRAEHEQFLAENILTPAEQWTHFHAAGGTWLPELRNWASGKVMRPGGATWFAQAIRRDETVGEHFFGAELIEVEVATVHHERRASVELTTGEARVLAATLLAVCDRLDGLSATP
jgi:hypothetical protein